MSRLQSKGTGVRGYHFKAVRNNDSRIEGGLGSLDKLYIPINVNNVHWNFIRVAITNKIIQLFDLQGVNAENKSTCKQRKTTCTRRSLKIREKEGKTLQHGKKTGPQQTNQETHQGKETGTTARYSP